MAARINLPPELEQAVINAYLSGNTLPTLIKQFGLSKKLIRRVLNEQNARRKPGKLNDEQKLAVVSAYTQKGVSINELAGQYGVSQTTIAACLKAAGLDLTRKALTDEQIRYIVHAYTVEQRSIVEIGLAVGFSSVSVNKTLEKLNIPRRGSFKFTSKQQNQIVADYQSGESSESIARRLGVDGTCIARLIKRNGGIIRDQRISNTVKKQIIADYQAGKFVRLIAEETGVDSKTIIISVKGAGLPLRIERGKLPRLKDQVIDLYQSGMTADQVGTELGLTRANVSLFLNNSGLSRPPAVANRQAALKRLEAWEGCYLERRKLRDKIRGLFLYDDWRNAVFARDNHTCQQCGATEQLEADHRYPFSAILFHRRIATLEEAVECADLWDVNNGRVLCKSCHKKTPTYGRKAARFRRKPNYT